MKITVYKKTEVDISVEEIAKDIIEEFEYDADNIIQDYFIEELPDYVCIKLEKYVGDEEEGELNKVYDLVLPKLKEIYTKKVNKYKQSEIEDNFSDRESILEWIHESLDGSYFLSPEDVLNAILTNGTKSRT